MNKIEAELISTEKFSEYGTVVEASEDGAPYGELDAKLILDRGIPRFYIMELGQRELTVKQITRHRQVTQVLASVGGETWYLVVAPPSEDESDNAQPDTSKLKAFEIGGDVAIKLHRGTWHAGPYYLNPTAKFFNLELSDTNIVDHHTWMMKTLVGNEIALVVTKG